MRSECSLEDAPLLGHGRDMHERGMEASRSPDLLNISSVIFKFYMNDRGAWFSGNVIKFEQVLI